MRLALPVLIPMAKTKTASNLTLGAIFKPVLAVAGTTMGVTMLTTLGIEKATRTEMLDCYHANAAEKALPFQRHAEQPRNI